VQDFRYLLALLNSRLIHFLYNHLVGEQTRIFPEVKPVQLFKLPIRLINNSEPSDKAHRDKIMALVDLMTVLQKKLSDTKLEHERNSLKRQIDGTDRQIDYLIYELYGLTEKEIKIVEEETI
jgi:hypothetical protein